MKSSFLCYFIFEIMPASIGTANENPMDISHVVMSGLTNEKTVPRIGMYMHAARQSREVSTANSRNGFEKKGTENKDFSSLLHSKT